MGSKCSVGQSRGVAWSLSSAPLASLKPQFPGLYKGHKESHLSASSSWEDCETMLPNLRHSPPKSSVWGIARGPRRTQLLLGRTPPPKAF